MKESPRLKRKLENTEKIEVNQVPLPKKIKDEISKDESMVSSETEPVKQSVSSEPKQQPQRIQIQKVEELPKIYTKIEMEQEPIEYFEPFKDENNMDIPVGGEIEVEVSKEIHAQNVPIVEQTVVVETTQRDEIHEYSPRKDIIRLELEMAKKKIRDLQKELDNKQNEILRKNIEILNLKRKLQISQQEILNLQSTITIQEPEDLVVEEHDESAEESAVVSDINSYTTVAGKKLYYVVVNKDRFLQIPLPEGNAM